MSGWIEAGCNEYLKRMPSELNLEIIELPMGHRGKGADVQRAVAREGGGHVEGNRSERQSYRFRHAREILEH